MSLLNLGVGELIALFGTVSAVLVTLYMLDRSRRHQVVATLRFWRHADSNTELRQRRKIQQPWSLVLQLVSIALLLLAIAQLQWGSLERNTRDHVVILDTSAWMGARTARGTVLDDARTVAIAFLKSLPQSDRVLLLRADSLATPVTPMETNRAVVERAIRDSRPSSSALNLDLAIEFARRVQSGQGRQAGEIVYVGPARTAAAEALAGAVPANLRVLQVKGPAENCGIRRIGLRRSASAPDEWEVFLSARNYGVSQQVAQLAVQFSGSPIGSRTLTLKPGADQESAFTFRTRAAGWIEARLLNQDAFPDDNRVTLEVPAQSALRVAVYTSEPELLRPVLAANPRIAAQFLSPAQYTADAKVDVVILDRLVPPTAPRVPSIWIEPPAQKSPVAVKAMVTDAKLTRWNGDHELGAGLRTRDLKIETAEVFQPSAGDVAVAESERGPVILARQPTNSPKLVVLGFHPVRSGMKYELATPLLFANLLRWVRPDLFRHWELNGGTVGTVDLELDKRVDPKTVRVIGEGHAVPYTIAHNHLRFYSGTPGRVQVVSGDREVVYSLTLPEVGLAEWTVPERVRRGIPRTRVADSPVTDLWPWLAALGMLGLLAEWMLFGRGRRAGKVARVTARTRQRVLQKRAS